MADRAPHTNKGLQSVNAILIIGSLWVVFFGIREENELYRDRLTDLHKHAHLTPRPCGLALPRVPNLIDGISGAPDWPRDSDGYRDITEKVAGGMCESDSIHNFINYIMSSDVALATAPSAAFLPAEDQDEAAFLDRVCMVDTDPFGDIRTRIDRTYSASKAAFVRLDACTPPIRSPPPPSPAAPPASPVAAFTDCSAGGECSETEAACCAAWRGSANSFAVCCGDGCTECIFGGHLPPFNCSTHTDRRCDCQSICSKGAPPPPPLQPTTYSEFPSDPFRYGLCHKSELVKSELKLAAGSDAEHVPTSKQLYRLLALAVAGYYDRTTNRNRCFGSRSDNATALCESVLGQSRGRTDWLAPAQETCLERDPLHEKVVTIPPPPPPDGLPQGPLEVCEATHQWGLFDLTRMFGVPDATGSFEVDTSPWFWFMRPIHKALFRIDDTLASYNTGSPDYPAQLRLYAAYRISVVTARAMLGNAVVGFIFGFAVVSSFLCVLPMLLKCLKLTSTPPKEGVRPPVRTLLPIVFLCGVLFWAWGVWVDPYVESSPHYTSTSCIDRWASDGGPWPSMHEEPRTW